MTSFPTIETDIPADLKAFLAAEVAGDEDPFEFMVIDAALWLLRASTMTPESHRAEMVAKLQASLDGVPAGLGRPAEECLAELKQRFAAAPPPKPRPPNELALWPELAEFIQQEVDAGRYESSAHVVNDAIARYRDALLAARAQPLHQDAAALDAEMEAALSTTELHSHQWAVLERLRSALHELRENRVRALFLRDAPRWRARIVMDQERRLIVVRECFIRRNNLTFDELDNLGV